MNDWISFVKAFITSKTLIPFNAEVSIYGIFGEYVTEDSLSSNITKNLSMSSFFTSAGRSHLFPTTTHGIFIPTYFIAVLMNLNVFFALMIPSDAKWKILLLILLTSAVFPMLILYSMYRFKLIKSISMDSREDRLYPYAATSIFFFLTTYMIWQISISPVYYYIMMAASILALLTLLINIYWKISAHTVSMGGMLGILVALQSVLLIDILWLIAVTLMLAGLVGFARLRAGTHTQAQVYAGYILGYLLSFFLVLYF